LRMAALGAIAPRTSAYAEHRVTRRRRQGRPGEGMMARCSGVPS